MKSMTRMMCVVCVAFVLAAPLSGAQSAAPSVEYAGLTHTALGRATLALVDDSLVVSNIGPGGLEGVNIAFDQLASHRTEWRDFSADTNTATLVQVTTMGVFVGHALEDRLASLFVGATDEHYDSAGVIIEANFEAVRAHRFSYEIYDDGLLVDMKTDHFGFIVASPESSPMALWPVAVTQLGEGDQSGYALEWSQGVENLTFAFGRDGSVQAVGDELRILAADLIDIAYLTGSEFRIGDVSTLTIVGENAQATP